MKKTIPLLLLSALSCGSLAPGGDRKDATPRPTRDAVTSIPDRDEGSARIVSEGAMVATAAGIVDLAGDDRSSAQPSEGQVRPAAVEVEPTPQLSRREVVSGILPRSVRVLVYDGEELKRSASGVVIGAESDDGIWRSFVITNHHVVDATGMKAPSYRVLIEDRWEQVEHVAKAVAFGSLPGMDLGLVEVPGVQLPRAELATDEELGLGLRVIVAAAPYGKSLSVSGGMVSHVTWNRELRRPDMLKTDAPIGYGASGGGIFSAETGRLIAIVEGYRTAKVGFEVGDKEYSFDVPMPGETFAAPAAKVERFLTENGYGRLLTPEADSRVTAALSPDAVR